MTFLWAMRSTWPATTAMDELQGSASDNLPALHSPQKSGLYLSNLSKATSHPICNQQVTYTKIIFDRDENRSQAFHRSKPALKS